jgi:tRNA pseudouridine38-40 synthase
LSNNDAEPDGDRSAVLALTISYHGANFAGSQRQGEKRTVQLELERAVSELWNTAAKTVFAGRTDRGVHAAGQVVGASDRRPDLQAVQIRDALNARLPNDLAVVSVDRREPGFHARYDACWREYRYRVWSGARQPLAAGLVAQRDGRLDLESMMDGAGLLVGRHDLASFAGDGEGVPWSERRDTARGTTRTVIRCSARRIEPWWTESGAGELIELRVAADGFLPKMVRNVAGALIEIGRGRRPPEWITALLAGKDRRHAAMTAPADGLILWRVGYDGDVPSVDR